MTLDLRQEAKIKAAEIRSQLGFNDESVSDIFTLIESLDILLAKKPLKRDSLSAFFLHYKDSFLIYINTAQSLGRQNFSAAHELYHYYYDKEMTGSICKTFKFQNQQRENEKLADYFAVNFLMPEDSVLKFMKRIGYDNITLSKIIKAQHYFKVSFSAILVRLKVLGIITNRQYEEFKSTRLSYEFSKLGFSANLIVPTNDTYVPQNYVELLNETYDNELISFTAYTQYLEDVGKSVEDFQEIEGVEEYVEETSFDY